MEEKKTTAKERVELEQIELNEKINKLAVFLGSDKFKELNTVQQALLMSQFDVMRTYDNILCQRLKYWD